jgi:outer membrane protein assembly factor BamA
MAIYEVGWQTVAPLTVAPYAEFRTGANNPALIYEMGFFVNAATASSVGIYRPAAIGVTPATTTVPIAVDSDYPTATAIVANTWGTAPTISSNVSLRRAQLSANIGAGIVWTWPVTPLRIPKASSLVIWNFGAATASVLNAYISYME